MPRLDPVPRINRKTGLLQIILRWSSNPRRKPPESGVPQPAVPPTGPRPLSGGAEAPLEFES